jgi:hypothetical protein
MNINYKIQSMNDSICVRCKKVILNKNKNKNKKYNFNVVNVYNHRFYFFLEKNIK